MDEVTSSRLILASVSPRRRDLLTQAGYAFEVVPSDIDESAFEGSSAGPREHAEALALAKARSVASRYPDALVIGADTLVDCDGEIIGKPADAEEAEAITRKLFSAPHKVITGLALIRLRDNTQVVRSDVTIVYPRQMTQEQIARHIAGGSWEGKAGAYAIQETGDEFVDHIEGSLTNVMGLPMELLQRLLNDLCRR
ncbi:MAG: septum formation protein Maf [Planctomycetaceae bacterium]|nr:MAG: septum formation protein Maf [Planctomycetaceae bacterium]